MKTVLSVFAFLLIAVMPFAVGAQEERPLRFTKEEIDDVALPAHNNLAGAKISNGELIGEERAKTLKYPLLPYDLMEFIIIRGTLAGFAEHCGLDARERFYAPLMQGLRAKQKDFTDYQWAFVGMLHGVSMGSAAQSAKASPCDDEMKQNLEKAALR